MKYIARATEEIKNKDAWSSYKVGVLEVDDAGVEKQVGEYTRNYYENVGVEVQTFYAFKQKGKWYALYSKDYTATRVMSLPDCKDICGEDDVAYGFCPVEYYVPTKEDLDHWNPIRIHNGKRDSEDDEHWAKLAIDLKCHEREGFDFNAEEDAKKKREWARKDEEFYLDIENVAIGQFAFVSGCVWGDDGSLKLEYLDLSKISEGIFKREAKFGYFELPAGKDLKECLNFNSFQGASFTQLRALKEVSIPVMDRHWGEQLVGTIWKFKEDSIFNGLKVKVVDWDVEGSTCEILESKNKVKDNKIYLVDYLFEYAKEEKS